MLTVCVARRADEQVANRERCAFIVHAYPSGGTSKHVKVSLKVTAESAGNWSAIYFAIFAPTALLVVLVFMGCRNDIKALNKVYEQRQSQAKESVSKYLLQRQQAALAADGVVVATVATTSRNRG